MLKNAKIRTKILLSFGVVIVLSLGTILWLLVQMTGIAQTTQQLYREPYTASNAMWSIRRNLIDSQRALDKLMSVEDGQLSSALNLADETFAADGQSMEQALTLLDALVADDDQEMADLLTEIRDLSSQGTLVREEIVSLIKSGRHTQANALLESSYEPLFDACNTKVLALFEIVEEDAQNFVESAQSSGKLSITVGMVILAVGLVTALLIVAKISRALVLPLK